MTSRVKVADEGGSRAAEEKEHHAPSLTSFASQPPKRLALALVGVLFVWTALLAATAHVSGFGTRAAAPLPPRPLGLSTRRRLRSADGVPSAAARDEQLDKQWTEKLLADLQQSSSVSGDESVAATLAELRSTLEARDDRAELELAAPSRASSSGAPAGANAAAAAGAAGVAAQLKLAIPRYDPKSVKELQKAALEAALPSEVKGPVPQLVRDMSAAMAKQQQDYDTLARQLTMLQPNVLNYNPDNIEQLSKAVETAVREQGPEVSGALPKLLRDLSKTLTKQQQEAKALERRMAAADKKKERSTRRARTLREIVMGRAPYIEDKVTLLFGELADQIEQVLEEAKQAAPTDAGPDSGPWSETIGQLQQMVLDEFRAAAERNATAYGQLDEERKKRIAAEEAKEATAASAAAAAASCATAAAAAPAGLAPSAEGATAAAAQPAFTSTFATDGASSPTPAAAASDANSAAASVGADLASAAMPTTWATGAASSAAASPPPAAAQVLTDGATTGVCAGKKCPAGYDMVDRGDRCTCRPRAGSR